MEGLKCYKCNREIITYDIPESAQKQVERLRETEKKKYMYGECKTCDGLWLVKILKGEPK